MFIIFVGDKPSSKNLDPDIPFVGTNSYPVLMNWVGKLQIHWQEFTIYNKDNAYLIRCLNLQTLQTLKCVALGNEASKELSKNNIDHFKLPHPSGRNRLLNDKAYVDKVLKECYNYVHGN